MVKATTPQQLSKEGKAAYQKSDYLEAAQAFEAAQAGFEAAGEKLDAAEAANNASVAYLQNGDGEAALRSVQGSAAIFAEAGDLRRQGMALANQGAALEALERNEDALQAYEQAAKILEQAGEDQLRVQVMQSVSMLQLNMGRQLQALASMQAGLEGVRRPTPKQAMLKRLLQIPIEMVTRKKSS